MNLNEVNTPALILDLDKLEKNIKKMSSFLNEKNVYLRPHAKNHKNTKIANMQIKAGANGVCVATVNEAEVMAKSGVKSILVANQIVETNKIKRLIEISKKIEVIMIIDDFNNADQISKIAENEKQKIDVLIDINLNISENISGVLDRCGIPFGKPVLDLAKKVSTLNGINFRGIMGYDGGVYHVPLKNRKEEFLKYAEQFSYTVKLLKENGLNVDIVSASGTGTFLFASEIPEITEIQAGSYIFLDSHSISLNELFSVSLTILSTVISKPKPNKVIIDAGRKSISDSKNLPTVKNNSNLKITSINAEHAHVEFPVSTQINIGDKIELIPFYHDPTVNLYSKYTVIRNDQVVDEWVIDARDY